MAGSNAFWVSCLDRMLHLCRTHSGGSGGGGAFRNSTGRKKNLQSFLPIGWIASIFQTALCDAFVSN